MRLLANVGLKHPGGKRDVLRTADFNDGSTSAFAPDSGTWAETNGALDVAAATSGKDAVAVYNPRATIAAGFGEGAFSARDRNQRSLRVG